MWMLAIALSLGALGLLALAVRPWRGPRGGDLGVMESAVAHGAQGRQSVAARPAGPGRNQALVYPTAQTGAGNRPTLFHRVARSAAPAWWTRDDLRVNEVRSMLYTIAVVLLVLWLLGAIGTFTIGPFVHVLLVVAVVLFLVQVISGRRSLA